MKSFVIRILPVIITQQLAMIFFMRVVYWGLFTSAALSAAIAMTVGLTVDFIHRRIAARNHDV